MSRSRRRPGEAARGTARRPTRRSRSARRTVGSPALRLPPLLTPEQRREVGGVLVVGAGAVLGAIVALPGGGSAARPIHDSLVWWLGGGAWLLAAGLVLVGVRVLGEERWIGGLVGGLGSGLATAAVLGLWGLAAGGSAGTVGQHLGPGLARRLGAAGATTGLLAAACVGLVLALDLRLGRIATRLAAWGRSATTRTARHHRAAVPPGHSAPSPPPATVELGARPQPPPAFGGLDPGLEPIDVELGGVGERLLAAANAVASDAPSPGSAVASSAVAAVPTGGEPSPVSTPPLDVDAAENPDGTGEAPGGDESEPAWVLPGPELLDTVQARRERLEQEVRAVAATIESTLQSFGVEARVRGVNSGPTVTQYELQPAKGVPVRRIVAHHTDLSLALAAPIRIQAPIPGKAAIGIEVPNQAAQLVTIREVVTSAAFAEVRSRLGVALGADVSGHPVVGDLTRMPHLLIAGATGSGKSVCINAILAGFLLQATPAQLKLILIDPKRVELSNFADLPHLLVPVVVEPEAAVASLRWAVREMEERYKLFAGHGARNILAFNDRAPGLGLRPLPYIVVVIDELADLMMVAAGEIEDLICRVAQLARAVGIHLVVATQRPSADIITGLIKANIPSRIAFAVSSGVDSRVILDEMGAEKLLGRGDMLYLPIDEGKPRRLQGAYVSDRELERLIDFWKRQGRPEYQEEIFQVEATVSWAREAGRRDPLFAKAAHVVAAEGRAAASLLQRKLNIGYTRAARLIDQLAEHRIVGPYEGSKSREVLMDAMQVDELLADLGEE